MPDFMVSQREAASKLGVSPRTVWNWVRSGRIASMADPDGQVRADGEPYRAIPAAALEEFITAGAPRPKIGRPRKAPKEAGA